VRTLNELSTKTSSSRKRGRGKVSTAKRSLEESLSIHDNYGLGLVLLCPAYEKTG